MSVGYQYMHAKADSTYAQIPCGSVDSFSDQGISLEYALNDFWDALRPSLRDQGIYLYDLGRPDHAGPNTRAPKEWSTPLKSTWAPLPYARCVDAREVKSRTFPASVCIAEIAYLWTPTDTFETDSACVCAR